MNNYLKSLIDRTREFSSQCQSIDFDESMYVYHPLQYAWDFHEDYLTRYVAHKSHLLMLGMNPGPFGMAQTGVPFGEVSFVKEYLQIEKRIAAVPQTHPKRPIQGLDCPRSEVSGRRLWSLIQQRYPNPASLRGAIALMNYCPVVFVDRNPTGKNITPDKIEKNSRKLLEEVCDSYIDDILAIIEPEYIVGVGKYAQKKLQGSVKRLQWDKEVISILHPSPANPQAHKNWDEKVSKTLIGAGIWQESS